MTTDPLEQFFETPEKLEGRLREKLAGMIIPFAAADPVDGTIHPKNAWHALDAKRKILVFLLSRLALSTKNPDVSAGLSPTELEEMTGLPGGTVRPKLSSLVKDHAAHRETTGQYSIRATSIAIDNAFSIMEDALKDIKR